MTDITIRQSINLFESAIMESSIDQTLPQFLASPQGELMGYSFADAKTPQELQRAIIGSATEVHQSAKGAGGWDEARVHGVVTPDDMKRLLSFAKAVATSPQEYFDAYQRMQTPRLDAPVQESELTIQDDLEAELPYLQGDEKARAEHKVVELEAENRLRGGF